MPFDTALAPERILDDAWAEAGPAALIDHILRRYHEVHRAQFLKAIDLARRVETVHQNHPRCPRGLADHLAIMADHLMSHQGREEAVLFPMMLAGGHPMIRHPVARMEEEHRDVDQQLLRLATLTTDFTPPEDACGSWRALYRGCQEIAEDLREHMRLENDILFPRFVPAA
ncbi:MAG: hemerythrin domain-containing protein [Caulobacterales bacterium]|nr:hemerythrin domain-containing protein [Caulobacterales bacterium]